MQDIGEPISCAAAADFKPTIAACRLIGAGKRFFGTWAVRHVDLEFRAGEVHAVMGENGAGKSTLMKMLHGVHLPDEGHVEVFGRRRDADFTACRGSRRHRNGAARARPVPRSVRSSRTSSSDGRGREPASAPLTGRRCAGTALSAFARLDIAIDVDAPIRSLSGANAQMVEIARALMHDARIVIMDEPTAALTEREAQRLFGILGELKRRGVAIIYISHRLDEVFQIADHITVMRDGERIHTGPTSGLEMTTPDPDDDRPPAQQVVPPNAPPGR